MVLVWSLGAAFCYAAASVLQQRAAATQPSERSLRPSLLVHLLANRLWLAGVVADVAGYGLQFLALSKGSLVVVQPLLVSGLLFALPLSALIDGRRMKRRDWIGGIGVVVGLSVFLVVASPRRGTPTVSTRVWIALLVATLGPVAVIIVASRAAQGVRRAVMLASAAGITYGLDAALTKTTAHLLDAGVLSTLGHWQPYTLVVTSILGMLLAQSAFQCGTLGSSLPALTVTDPIVSMAIGAVAFGEGISIGGLAPLFEVVGVVAMVAGVFGLAGPAQIDTP